VNNSRSIGWLISYRPSPDCVPPKLSRLPHFPRVVAGKSTEKRSRPKRAKRRADKRLLDPSRHLGIREMRTESGNAMQSGGEMPRTISLSHPAWTLFAGSGACKRLASIKGWSKRGSRGYFPYFRSWSERSPLTTMQFRGSPAGIFQPSRLLRFFAIL